MGPIDICIKTNLHGFVFWFLYGEYDDSNYGSHNRRGIP
jgi:hypothetical protein